LHKCDEILFCFLPQGALWDVLLGSFALAGAKGIKAVIYTGKKQRMI
jgi:hypothetical protein